MLQGRAGKTSVGSVDLERMIITHKTILTAAVFDDPVSPLLSDSWPKRSFVRPTQKVRYPGR
jgi:hypothetical protein